MSGDEDERLKHQSRARVTTLLPRISFVNNPSMDVDFGFEVQDGGRRTIDAGLALSALLQQLSVYKRVSVERESGGGEPSDNSVLGELSLGGRVGDLSIRSGITYELAPDLAPETVNANVSYPIGESTNLSFSVERELEEDRTTSYTARLNRNFDVARIGLITRYEDDEDSLFVGLSLGFSIFYDRAADRPTIVSETIARRGMALPRTFLDLNANGAREEDEPLLEGVELDARGARSKAATGSSGEAMLTSLPVHAPMTVTVHPESLESPYWKPASLGRSIVPRPGRVALLDLPILPTAEIDGTVTLLRGGNENPAGNVAVQLVGEGGAVAAEVRSAFDGFFLFEGIRPGLYILRIDSAQRARLGLADPAPRIIVIRPDTEVVANQNFRLRRRQSDNLLIDDTNIDGTPVEDRDIIPAVKKDTTTKLRG